MPLISDALAATTGRRAIVRPFISTRTNPIPCPISTGAFTVASIALSIFAHNYIATYKTWYLTNLDFAALKEFSEMWGTLYTESTFWFDAHYVVYGLMLLVSVLLVANAVWKVNLMKDEAKLVEEGRRAEA